MQTTTLIFIFLAILFSVIVAFFQYFFKVKKKPKINILLFILKALSVFLLLLLLINPKINNTKHENIKPALSVLVDNSLSTKYFKEEGKVKDIITAIKADKALHKKFDVSFFSFGKDIKKLDSLTFDEPQTDIAKAIQSVNELYRNKLATTVLISDGNSTIGNDYEFVNSKQAVNTLVVGDTTRYIDVRISQLNVNKYSYLKNKFPVEILLYYDGKEPVNSIFTITKDGKTVFSKKVSFSADNNTQTISAELTSNKEGLQYYTAGISRLQNEKNVKNNYKSFSVEVIDEQTKVLILASVLHPDLGALKKAIESNKQRKVTIHLVNKFKGNIINYQLVVFFQPNSYFKNLFQQRKSNFIVVSGAKTDWNFINQQQLGFSKKAINQSENYQAVYNSSFLTFLQKDIGFGEFPPLKDKFGDITVSAEHQNILFQKVVGIETNQPLISTFEKGEQKYATIFGEGIWKWRATSYLKEQSFDEFDSFISNLVQYVASNKKRKRLEVNTKRLYPANSNITISALYLDKTYKFDNRASLQITITNQATKEQKIVPFSLINNSYQVDIEGLPSGNYNYKVSVGGQNINNYGKFKIEDYQVEEQFTNANVDKLQKLTTKTGGKLFSKNNQKELLDNLIANKNYYTTQKQIIKQENLINWKWVLFLVVGLLTLEWFVRKYYGKI